MPSQIPLNLRLAADRIVIEDDPEAPDVKRQLGFSLSQQDGWFPKRMSVTQLIKYVWISRRYFCDDNLRLLYFSLDILKDDSRPSFLVDPNHVKSGGIHLALNDFA